MNPLWVRSFFILFPFHVGRVKGQPGALGGWRELGVNGVFDPGPIPRTDKESPPPQPEVAFVKV